MSTLFYRNVRLLILLVGVILVAGTFALEIMPRREDPELTPRNALLITRYPGADAERVEKLVTEKLEDVLDEFEEIKKTISTSRPGISTISIELEDHIDDVVPVWTEMRDDIGLIRAELPPEALDPVLDDLEIDASTVIFALAWTGPEEPRVVIMQRYAEELADLLRSVPGTKRTQFFGVNPEEITVRVDPERLASLGLTPDDVARAVRESDSKVGAGKVRGVDFEVGIEVRGELASLKQVRDLPVRYGEGTATVRVGDLGPVTKSVVEPPRGLAFADGDRAVVVTALIQSDQRIDQWGLEVDEVLESFEARLPGSIELRTLFDQRGYTEDRLGELARNLALGAGLVLIVVFLMMGWRSALVVGTALPLSTLMVLAGMNALDIPIHQMSVTGLIIALGLLIDNAIVMVDEVRHRLMADASRLGAVGDAVKSLAVPLFGSTLTTILSFMPIALMPGPAGEFVGSIAVSVSLAIASSFFLALTVVPALTARLGGAAGDSMLSSGFSWGVMTRAYRRGLRLGMRMPLLLLLVALILPVLGFRAAGGLTEQFFPPADRDQFPVELRLDPQASMADTRAVAARARELMLAHDEVEAVHWFLGGSAPKFYYNMLETENDVPWFGHALVQLKEPDESFGVLRRIQADLDRSLPEGQFLVRPLEQGPPFQAPVEIHILGPDNDVLHHLGEDVRRELSTLEGVTHTRATLADGVPELHFEPDAERSEALGLTRRSIARALESRLDGASGGSVIEGPEEIPVRVRVGDADRASVDRIASLELLAPDADGGARWVSLQTLADSALEPSRGDIEHKDGVRSNTIQGYVEAGTLPATVLGPMTERLASFELPPDYRLQIGGESEQRDRAVGNLMASVGVLLVLMVATLVLSFGSFRLAAVIGGVGILGVGLALGSLALFEFPFGFMAIVGTMGLIGVAINDSIVVLAAIREHPDARRGDRDAVTDVVVRSTKHVLATTLTTAVGFVPLMLSGGGFWPPVAVTIGGGVLGATVLALVFIPSSYVILHRSGTA